jgi:hypothetical protein
VQLANQVCVIRGATAARILLTKWWPPVQLAPLVKGHRVRATEEITGDTVGVDDDASELVLPDDVLAGIEVAE